MSRDARAEKVAEAICRRDDSMYHHDRTDGFPCTDCRETAAAVLDMLDDDAQETTAGRANDCTHGSASGVDTSDGPDKVWACDHCGLRWRQDGAPLNDDAQAKVDYDSDPEALAWARGKIERLVEQMRDFEKQATERGTSDPKQWRTFAWLLEHKLIGGGGCVIAGFDVRMPMIRAALNPEPAP